MPRLRHLLVLLAGLTAVIAFVPASPAAVDTCANPLPNRAGLAMPHCVATQHFEVWYTSDTGDSQYATFTQASDLATVFERAYATELGYGFTAPLDDGDGKTDVYIGTLPAGVAGLAVPDNPGGPTSSGYIGISPAVIGTDHEVHVVAHELFHLIQFATWVPQAKSDSWVLEGSAEWMGAKVNGYQPSDVEEVGPSDMPVDCRENLPTATYQKCSPDLYVEGGYSRWPFFEFLAQRFGVTFIQSALAQGAAGNTAIGAVQAAIAAKGSTLSDVFNDWATKQMTGYGISQLDTVKPTPYASVTTGTTTLNNLASLSVNVDHLATRYIEFNRGSGDPSQACYAATLSVTVTIPAGTLSKPTFYWDGPGSTPVPLSITGNTAAASIPWDTCTWLVNEGFLSLPNASMSVDSADFNVKASITVDTTTPAAASTAPGQVTVWGQVVSVPTTALPPAIVVYGPELLTLSASDRQLRLIVQSSGEGSLKASIGSISLGAGALVPGSNDIRFTLPATLLDVFRRSASTTTNILTLTPTAPSGSTQGPTVTRKIAITGVKPIPKAKPKAKPKPKPKPKKSK